MLSFALNAVFALIAAGSTVLVTKEYWRLGQKRITEGVRHQPSRANQNLWLVSVASTFALLMLHVTPFNGVSLILSIFFLVTGFLPCAALRLGEEAARIDRIKAEELS